MKRTMSDATVGHARNVEHKLQEAVAPAAAVAAALPVAAVAAVAAVPAVAAVAAVTAATTTIARTIVAITMAQAEIPITVETYETKAVHIAASEVRTRSLSSNTPAVAEPTNQTVATAAAAAGVAATTAVAAIAAAVAVAVIAAVAGAATMKAAATEAVTATAAVTTAVTTAVTPIVAAITVVAAVTAAVEVIAVAVAAMIPIVQSTHATGDTIVLYAMQDPSPPATKKYYTYKLSTNHRLQLRLHLQRTDDPHPPQDRLNQACIRTTMKTTHSWHTRVPCVPRTRRLVWGSVAFSPEYVTEYQTPNHT
jgi:hypothetical protein